MAKYFINVVQDYRTRLGIPVKTKTPFFPIILPFAEPSFVFKLHEDRNGVTQTKTLVM